MVSFFLFILVEMTALFGGLGWQLNQVLDSSRLNWLIVGGGIGCGLALGLIGGWLAGQTTNRQPRAVFLWLGAILGAAAFGAAGNYLLHLANPLVLLAAVGGSLLGAGIALGLGGLMQPSSQKKMAPQMMMAYPGPPVMPPQTIAGPVLLSEQELKRLRKRLYQEAHNLVQNPSLVSQSVAGTTWPEPQLFVVDPSHMALVLVIPCYLGQLTFFIVCPTGYPERAPVEVHMELVRPGGSAPITIDYDGRRLNNWQPGSNLANVLKDGFLQIEQTVLG
jgi:MFS family permease